MQKTVNSNHGLVLSNPFIVLLSYTTTPGQSGHGSDGNEGVLRIPQSPSITGASPSDRLVSYPGHSFGESYPSADKQSVDSTAPADWAKKVNWYVKDTAFARDWLSESNVFNVF